MMHTNIGQRPHQNRKDVSLSVAISLGTSGPGKGIMREFSDPARNNRNAQEHNTLTVNRLQRLGDSAQ